MHGLEEVHPKSVRVDLQERKSPSFILNLRLVSLLWHTYVSGVMSTETRICNKNEENVESIGVRSVL